RKGVVNCPSPSSVTISHHSYNPKGRQMSKAKGIREVGYVDIRQGGGAGHAHGAPGPHVQSMSWFDCAGGGQVGVEKSIAYLGNMRNPHGTLIVDVSDPKHPKQLAAVEMPVGTHS